MKIQYLLSFLLFVSIGSINAAESINDTETLHQAIATYNPFASTSTMFIKQQTLPNIESKINEESINSFNFHQQTPLHVAAGTCYPKIIDTLFDFALSKGLSIEIEALNENGKTALHLAAEKGNLKILQKLIEKGADVKAKDREGKSCLHLAVDFPDVVQYFIQLDSTNINAQDNDGDTPLHHAVTNQNIEIIELLFKNDADPDSKNLEGEAPIHCFAREGTDVNVIKIFIDNDADINIKTTFDECTPLQIAAHYNNEEVIKSLIENGADATIKDKHGKSASDRAKNVKMKQFINEQVEQKIETDRHLVEKQERLEKLKVKKEQGRLRLNKEEQERIKQEKDQNQHQEQKKNDGGKGDDSKKIKGKQKQQLSFIKSIQKHKNSLLAATAFTCFEIFLAKRKFDQLKKIRNKKKDQENDKNMDKSKKPDTIEATIQNAIKESLREQRSILSNPFVELCNYCKSGSKTNNSQTEAASE